MKLKLSALFLLVNLFTLPFDTTQAQIFKKMKEKLSGKSEKKETETGKTEVKTKQKYESGDIVWIKDDNVPEGKIQGKILSEKLYINKYFVYTTASGSYDCEASDVLGLYTPPSGGLQVGEEVYIMSPTYTSLETGKIVKLSGVGRYDVQTERSLRTRISENDLLSGWDYGAFYAELQPYFKKQDIQAYFYQICGECSKGQAAFTGSSLGEERTKTLEADIKAMQAMVARYSNYPDNGQKYYFHNPKILVDALNQWGQLKNKSQSAGIAQEVANLFFSYGPRDLLTREYLKGSDGQDIKWDEYALWKGLEKIRPIMIANIQNYAQNKGMDTDPEQVLADAQYDQKIAEKKKEAEEGMQLTRELISQYKYTDPNVSALVKRDVTANPVKIIMKQAPGQWIIEKNGLGVILRRKRMGMAFRTLSGSPLWLGYTFSVVEEYSGGGTYSSPACKYNPEARYFAKPF